MAHIAKKSYEELRWTPEMVNAFWDWQSQHPENYFTYNCGDGIVRTFGDRLRGNGRVLDYGCGVGYLLPHLCRHARQVYGADVSVESVEQANERVPRGSVFKGAFLVSELRAREEKFDVIFVVEVIEHLYDETLDIVLDDVRKLLSGDGVVIFTTPNNENRSQNMILCPVTGQLFHRWQHVRSWTAESLSDYLRRRGFDVVEAAATNFTLRQPISLIRRIKRLIRHAIFGHPGNPHLFAVASRSRGQ